MSDQGIGEILRRLAALEEWARQPQAEAALRGTFTPGLAGSGTPGTFTYDVTNSRAQYTLVDDRLHFNGRVIITATAVAPTGNISITGLPIAAGANSGNNGNILGGAGIAYTGINLAAGYTQVQGVVTGSATSMLLYEMGDNVARAVVQGGELAATWDFFFWGMYKVDL